MSTIRVRKRDDYFVADKTGFNETGLSWEARGLLAYLLSKPDDWKTRNKDLENQGPAGREKIARMLKELQEFGYMNRERHQDEEGKFRWETCIYENPTLNPEHSLENKETEGETIHGFTVNGSTVNGKPVYILKHDVLKHEEDQNTLPANAESETAKDTEQPKATANGNDTETELDTAVSAILEAWERLFPTKSQPRPTTYRKKIATRWKNPHFRENWLEAMELAAASPTCQRKSWFRFEFFVRNDENYQKCLDRWMSDFDAKLDNPHTNGRSSSITAPAEMEWESGPRFVTADN
jgi:hypothetical protein